MSSKICEHEKHKYYCKICGVGKGICEHGKVKYYCKKCGGKGICEHGKHKDSCRLSRSKVLYSQQAEITLQ